MNLSVAENSREILAQRNVTIMIQTENKNVTRTSDNNCEKCERIESPSTVKLSLAEESHEFGTRTKEPERIGTDDHETV